MVHILQRLFADAMRSGVAARRFRLAVVLDVPGLCLKNNILGDISGKIADSFKVFTHPQQFQRSLD
jgi:hypothetical protein